MSVSANGWTVISGTAVGEILYSDTTLSFWGGVDLITGNVIDHHHPLHGHCLRNRILAIPSGKGSCSGSAALLELLYGGCAPAAIILSREDPILALGVLVARWLFSKSIPVTVLDVAKFKALESAKHASIEDNIIHVEAQEDLKLLSSEALFPTASFSLSTQDQQILSGDFGEAAKVAIQLILQYASMQKATQLIDVTQAHIDACIFTGPAGLQFATKLKSLGAKFLVPATLNAISIDQRRMGETGMRSASSEEASVLANTYLDMGATMSLTCAPYSLSTAPQQGDQIGWAESNAVIFANSILGARTQKYPDFLDVCIALTGRAPFAGCHTDQGRRPQLRIHVKDVVGVNDGTYPLLGYAVGRLAGDRVPLVTGMELLAPTTANLKSFCAAFGTTASAPMFHIAGVTPEASGTYALPVNLSCLVLTNDDLITCLKLLNTAQDPSVQLISLGNPHFLIEEFDELAQLCRGRKKDPSVDFVVTTSRETLRKVAANNLLEQLEKFGIDIITDTCWCMLGEPVIGPKVKNIMTNSAKYAHYGPGLVKRGINLGSLEQCVDAACTGSFTDGKNLSA